jgi:hypothetical protein
VLVPNPPPPVYTPGLRCPECGTCYTRIVDSRAKTEFVRRRRECRNKHRFTTYEKPYQPPTPRQPPYHWLAHNRIPT